MREIPLTQGQVALVDDEDYERVMQHKWYAQYDRHTRSYYAVCRMTTAEGKQKHQSLHRFILSAPKGTFVDHKDHNPLHNWRTNLRLCTRSQNGANQRKSIKNTTGYKGVWWNRRTNKFHARIEINHRNHGIGAFETAIEAARAYNAKALEAFGEFAYINELPSSSCDRSGYVPLNVLATEAFSSDGDNGT